MGRVLSEFSVRTWQVPCLRAHVSVMKDAHGMWLSGNRFGASQWKPIESLTSSGAEMLRYYQFWLSYPCDNKARGPRKLA